MRDTSAGVAYKSIGIIYSDFKELETAPVQSVFATGTTGRVELFPEYTEGLKDITAFSHILLIYKFHLAGDFSLIGRTHICDEEHSIFAMKKVERPNAIGMSIVKLDGVKGAILEIRELDIVNGTPLLDIKPFVPLFDNRPFAASGWVSEEHLDRVRSRSERSIKQAIKKPIERNESVMRAQDFSFDPIGMIRTRFKDKKEAPIQGVFADKSMGMVEVLPEYTHGLRDVGGFSHLMLFYHFHLASAYSLISMPFLEEEPHGIFSIRHFNRPNPIGMSVVKLEHADGNILHISEVDILDQTPLLDIKPFVPAYDNRAGATGGWLNQPNLDMTRGEAGKHRAE